MNKSIKNLLLFIAVAFSNVAVAQEESRFPKNQISINLFRNPSIGLEYHRREFSIHAGYYPTNFESNVTTEFMKAGLTYWFLPWGKRDIPSSLYAGVSVLRGTTRDYRDKNAVALETGVRLTIWKGLSFRFGVIGLAAPGESFKVNPTPSFNYTIKF